VCDDVLHGIEWMDVCIRRHLFMISCVEIGRCILVNVLWLFVVNLRVLTPYDPCEGKVSSFMFDICEYDKWWIIRDMYLCCTFKCKIDGYWHNLLHWIWRFHYSCGFVHCIILNMKVMDTDLDYSFKYKVSLFEFKICNYGK
jgi:hypothetical protein